MEDLRTLRQRRVRRNVAPLRVEIRKPVTRSQIYRRDDDSSPDTPQNRPAARPRQGVAAAPGAVANPAAGLESPDSPDSPDTPAAPAPAIPGAAAPAPAPAVGAIANPVAAPAPGVTEPPSPASPDTPDTPLIPGQTAEPDSPSPTQATFPPSVAQPPPPSTVAPPPPPATLAPTPAPAPAPSPPPPPPPPPPAPTTAQRVVEQTTSQPPPPPPATTTPPTTTAEPVIAQPVLAAPVVESPEPPSPTSPDTPTFAPSTIALQPTQSQSPPAVTATPILPGVTPGTERKSPGESADPPNLATTLTTKTRTEIVGATGISANQTGVFMERPPHIASVEDIVGVTLGSIALVVIIFTAGMFLYYFKRRSQPGGQDRPPPFLLSKCFGRRDKYHGGGWASDTSSQAGGRTESKMIGDMYTAAWAAENGNGEKYDNNPAYGYGQGGTPPVHIAPGEKRAWNQFPTGGGVREVPRARESVQTTSTVARWLRELTPFLSNKRNTGISNAGTAVPRGNAEPLPAPPPQAVYAAPPLPGLQSRWSDSTKQTPPSPSMTSRAGDPSRVSALTEDSRGQGRRGGPKTESSLFSLYATRTNVDDRASGASWAKGLTAPSFRPGTMRTVDSEELEKWGIPGVGKGGRDDYDDLPPVPVTPATVFDRERR